MVCKCVAARENRGVMGDIGKAYRAIARQWMLRGGDEIQRVVPHRHGLNQRVRFGCQGDYRYFGAAMEYLVVGGF
ncbi:hypothetical protein D3C79_1030970 [compost metagenome]